MSASSEHIYRACRYSEYLFRLEGAVRMALRLELSEERVIMTIRDFMLISLLLLAPSFIHTRSDL